MVLFLHAIVIRLGLAGDGSFLHAILMDIVWLEMSFLHALVLLGDVFMVWLEMFFLYALVMIVMAG